jgi:hypothetical protein
VLEKINEADTIEEGPNLGQEVVYEITRRPEERRKEKTAEDA